MLAAPASSPEADAEAMYQRGQAKYETADFAGAIELWTEAYVLVSTLPDNAAIQSLLIYNLAQAHIKAYEFDADAIHLKQAQQLLQSFRANLDTVYADTEQIAAEQAKIDEALADIDARMAALAEPSPEPEAADATATEPATDGPPPKPGKSGKPLIISGGVLAGLGVAFGVVGIVGAIQAADANDLSELDPDDLDARDDQFARGESANTLIAVGSIGAGVLVTTGVALLVVGVLRNKRNVASQQASRPRISPSFGPASAGLIVSGRF